MDIAFGSKKLQKILNSEKEIIREYGADNGRKIMMRMDVLKAAANLEAVSPLPPSRRHDLTGSRKGQFAVDSKQPWRIVFKPNHDPVPLSSDGGINLKQVTAITILSVEDYH